MYFNSGIVLRNVNSGKKIYSYVCKHLKFIEKDDGLTMNKKEVSKNYFLNK